VKSAVKETLPEDNGFISGVVLRLCITKNLSHYQSMNPDVNGSDSQQRVEARGKALPPHHQTTILLLKPGEGPLGLQPRDHFLDRPAPVFLGLPDPLRDLRSDTPLASLLPKRFGIIASIRRDDLQGFPGAAPFTGPPLDRIQAREHLRPFVPSGRGGPVRQGHPVALGEAVDEHPFAFPPAGDALAPTLARGEKAPSTALYSQRIMPFSSVTPRIRACMAANVPSAS
jgi:hypothetical protein